MTIRRSPVDHPGARVLVLHLDAILRIQNHFILAIG